MKRSKILLILCLLLAPAAVQAQGARKAAKAVSAVASRLSRSEITGTWVYEGIDVRFESDKLLCKAGGAVASNRIEKELDELFGSVGFTPGITTFVFNADNTFENRTGQRTLKGTYTVDESKGTITLKYMDRIPLEAKMSLSGNRLSLLYETGAFLSLASFIAGNSGIMLLRSAGSMIKGYDGMMTGIALRRQ